jgi:4-hydroxy-3-methylbut-2-enyl diphosphate reductase
MEVILSKHAGFCYGVDNAIKIAEKTLTKHPGKDIFMLGELVHNEKVVKKIKSQGIKLIDHIKKIPEKSLVILSAHGHSPQIYNEAIKRKLKVIDATCPMVTKVHNLGKLLAKRGYYIIVIGDKEHGEVKAIYDQVKTITDKVEIVENAEQAKAIEHLPKTGIISQTTQSVEHFDKVATIIASKATKLKTCNTICDATRFRQTAAINIAKKVDLMIIIGSFNSANTKRLTNICEKIVETHQVNSAKELKKDWFCGVKTVGVSAGASTPDWIIKEVVEEIKKRK